MKRSLVPTGQGAIVGLDEGVLCLSWWSYDTPESNRKNMRVISLGSGSSGNALLVEAGPGGRTRLLVDAGFTGRVLTSRLRHAGVSPVQLTGILLTHEHIDHVLGLPFLLK